MASKGEPACPLYAGIVGEPCELMRKSPLPPFSKGELMSIDLSASKIYNSLDENEDQFYSL